MIVPHKITYIYDESGIVGAVQTYNSTTETFYFDRNIKGDVIGIFNASGTQIAKYSYDAWGNQKVTTYSSNNFSGYNPIRYRGYYFDAESGFYFLNARYYNPTWRRFISPDDTAYLDPDTPSGLNLYAYCDNNPVMGYDPNGTFDWNKFWKTSLGVTMAIGLAALAIGATIVSGGSLGLLVAGFAMGAAASFVGQGIGNVLSGERFFNDFSLSSIIMGGLAGAAFITGVGGFWGAVAIGAVSNAGTSALENKSWANIGASAIVGGISAGVGFGLGKIVSNYVFKNSGMTFIDYFELGIIDTNAIFAVWHAFAASWYTFLPSLTTSASRGVIKALGNKGIGWF